MTKNMTIAELNDKLKADVHNEGDKTLFMIGLYARYLDERNYEDANDYKKLLKEEFPESIKQNVKPFGITFACADGELEMSVSFKNSYAQFRFLEKRVA